MNSHLLLGAEQGLCLRDAVEAWLMQEKLTREPNLLRKSRSCFTLSNLSGNFSDFSHVEEEKVGSHPLDIKDARNQEIPAIGIRTESLKHIALRCERIEENAPILAIFDCNIPRNLEGTMTQLLEGREYFGQYGSLLKVSISRPASTASQQAGKSQESSSSSSKSKFSNDNVLPKWIRIRLPRAV
ncbi:hypothetical protein KSP39_PZI016341 [Platanthera zijinensis]|uniref:Uncharacterized protein n=1 Tax=Platanthera zijinensis TaxID=2320716 RepID=A0AAP0G0W8_9ASPA